MRQKYTILNVLKHKSIRREADQGVAMCYSALTQSQVFEIYAKMISGGKSESSMEDADRSVGVYI